jgi:hypothetical protein
MSKLLAVVTLFGVMFTQMASWGGDHIAIETTATGASVEFDCAHGTIDKPLKPNARGRFTLPGTFTPQLPGPTRDDGPPPRKATYSGTIEGDAMTLRVAIDGQDERRDFTLRRGERGNVRGCR